MTSIPEIELISVSKNFSAKKTTVRALKNISLQIYRGEVFGVIGVSGAGKSTLVRCLNYLEIPDSGSVKVAGVNLNDLSSSKLRQLRQEMGMIFQSFNLLMQRTIFDNVAFPLRIQGAGRVKIRSRVTELLELVGLEDKAKAYPAKLSGGQKQRVAIARALATNPRILLCDEATSALDTYTSASILELLQRINREFNITMVVITHQLQVVRFLCHRLAVLSEGILVESGKVDQCFADPKSETLRMLLGATSPQSPDQKKTHT